jgi:ubiquinone biosynthesis accessory factor UbiJ
MPATPVWLAAIEAVLNRSIDRSSRAAAAASRLNRTSLQIDVDGVGRMRAAVTGGRIVLLSGEGQGADAVIAGSPVALLASLAGGAPGAGQGGASRAGGGQGAGRAADERRANVHISGDAQIAARYRELFVLARPDLEEELSQFVGDFAARRASLIARAALSWISKAGRTAGENIAEYLTEESRDLATKAELEEFLAGVDRLRETADRVAARLSRIEQRLKGAA